MAPGPPSRSAVFLARVWLEGGLLRARITDRSDLLGGSDETVVVGSAEEIERRLHDWLRRVTAGGPG